MPARRHRARPGAANRVRIIGGAWRGRRIAFADRAGLRPTPDRVRETVFNWLAPWLAGARVLDLFAGSGAFGFEALSRGAAEAVLVDSDPQVVRSLQRQGEELGARGARYVCADALRFLAAPAQPFDVVFLDPPYGRGLLAPCARALAAGGWLAPDARLYLEAERNLTPELPDGWALLRSRQAGEVGYHLAARTAAAD